VAAAMRKPETPELEIRCIAKSELIKNR